MYAEVLPWTICLLTLVLIAQTVFLLQRGQTDRQTDATELPTPRRGAVVTEGRSVSRHVEIRVSTDFDDNILAPIVPIIIYSMTVSAKTLRLQAVRPPRSSGHHLVITEMDTGWVNPWVGLG